MDEHALRNKQKLASELNMKFEEVADLFSDETLNSMKMGKIIGGEDGWNFIGNCQCNCPCPNESNCNCVCDKDIGVCALISLQLPSLPITPSVTKPTSSGR